MSKSNINESSSKKTIIHHKFDPETVTAFQTVSNHRYLKKELGEDYILISSPDEFIKVDGDATLICIDDIELSYNKIIELIKLREAEGDNL